MSHFPSDEKKLDWIQCTGAILFIPFLYWFCRANPALGVNSSLDWVRTSAERASVHSYGCVTIALFTASGLRALRLFPPQLRAIPIIFLARIHLSYIFLRNIISNEKRCNNSLDGNDNFIISPTAAKPFASWYFWPASFGLQTNFISHSRYVEQWMSQSNSWVTRWPLCDKSH